MKKMEEIRIPSYFHHFDDDELDTGEWVDALIGKVERIIGFEAQQNVPFPIDEVVWDYQLVGGGTDEQIQVVLVAIKADLLDPRAMPDTLLHMCDRPLPTPEYSFQELLNVVSDQITEYEALAKQLRIDRIRSRATSPFIGRFGGDQDFAELDDPTTINREHVVHELEVGHALSQMETLHFVEGVRRGL